MTITLTREEAQVPLVEQLESVPQDARLCIDDADGMGTHYFPIGNMCHEAAKALRARLSAPEPEPVAWMLTELDGTPLIDCGDLVVKPRPVLVSDKTDCIPLYTAPPQREWVGLTDEDKNQIAKEAYNKVELTAWELAQRVGEFTEVKLKEKNVND